MSSKLLDPISELCSRGKVWIYEKWGIPGENTVEIQLLPKSMGNHEGFIFDVNIVSMASQQHVQYYAKVVTFDIHTMFVYNILKQIGCGPQSMQFYAMENWSGHREDHWLMGIVSEQVQGFEMACAATPDFRCSSNVLAPEVVRQKLRYLHNDAFLLVFVMTICKFYEIPLNPENWGFAHPTSATRWINHRFCVVDFSYQHESQSDLVHPKEHFLAQWQEALILVARASRDRDFEPSAVTFSAAALREDFPWLQSKQALLDLVQHAGDETIAWTDTSTASSGLPCALSVTASAAFSEAVGHVQPDSPLPETLSEAAQEERVRRYSTERYDHHLHPREAFDLFQDGQLQQLQEFQGEEGAIRREIELFFGWFDQEK